MLKRKESVYYGCPGRPRLTDTIARTCIDGDFTTAFARNFSRGFSTEKRKRAGSVFLHGQFLKATFSTRVTSRNNRLDGSGTRSGGVPLIH